MALVKDGADRKRGIPMMETAIRTAGTHVPAQAFIELTFGLCSFGKS
jgi:hypothetical protein